MPAAKPTGPRWFAARTPSANREPLPPVGDPIGDRHPSRILTPHFIADEGDGQVAGPPNVRMVHQLEVQVRLG